MQRELLVISGSCCRVAVVGQKFEPIASEVEKWYGTKYKLEKIPESVLDVSFLKVVVTVLSVYGL